MKGRFRPDPCLSHVAVWLRHSGDLLTPRREMAQRFLNWLDPDAEEFAFRTFSDTSYTRQRGYDPLERELHGSLDACWHELEELNRCGAVVAVTVNQTNGKGRGAADIERVRALFLDDDRGMEPELFGLHPHCRVESSEHHNHYYWLVSGLETGKFVDLQRRLAGRYGGDDRVCALNQAMQLPGFWRRKRVCQPHIQRVHYRDSAGPYSLANLSNLWE